MFSQNGMLNPSVNKTQLHCYYYKDDFYIVPSFTLVWTFVLIPLCLLVFHTGLRRWRENKRSTVSHTDFLMYNALFFEVIQYCGYVMFTFGSLHSINTVISCGLNIISFIFPGLMSFQVLVCIERYLAVVFPIVYLSLRKERGIWLRKCIVAVVWVFCSVWICVWIIMKPHNMHIPLLAWLFLASCIIFFCNVQVLRALKNPSPGEGGGVSRSKRRAFNTILIILSTLLLWLGESTVRIVIAKAKVLHPNVICFLQLATCWLKSPSSLVLPLLFLHRAGVLPKCPARKRTKTMKAVF